MDRAIRILSTVLLAAVNAEKLWEEFDRNAAEMYCARYALCTSGLNLVEQRCQVIGFGEYCPVENHFNDFRILLLERESQYDKCVQRYNNGSKRLEIQVQERISCDAIPFDNFGDVSTRRMTSSIECLQHVAKIRSQCQRLRRCCAFETSCDKELAVSEITDAIEVKKTDIARKMLDCLVKHQRTTTMNPNPNTENREIKKLGLLQALMGERQNFEIRRRPINYERLSKDVSVAQQLLRRRQKLYESQIARVRRLRRITAELARMINKRRLTGFWHRPALPPAPRVSGGSSQPPRAVPPPVQVIHSMNAKPSPLPTPPAPPMPTPPTPSMPTPPPPPLHPTLIPDTTLFTATVIMKQATESFQPPASLHDGEFFPPISKLTPIPDSLRQFAQAMEKNSSELTIRLNFDKKIDEMKKSLAYGVSNMVEEIEPLKLKQASAVTPPRSTPARPTAPPRVSLTKAGPLDVTTRSPKLPPEAFVNSDGLWTMIPSSEPFSTTSKTPKATLPVVNPDVVLRGTFKPPVDGALELLQPGVSVVDRDANRTAPELPQVVYKRTKPMKKLPELINARVSKMQPILSMQDKETLAIPEAKSTQSTPTTEALPIEKKLIMFPKGSKKEKMLRGYRAKLMRNVQKTMVNGDTMTQGDSIGQPETTVILDGATDVATSNLTYRIVPPISGQSPPQMNDNEVPVASTSQTVPKMPQAVSASLDDDKMTSATMASIVTEITITSSSSLASALPTDTTVTTVTVAPGTSTTPALPETHPPIYGIFSTTGNLRRQQAQFELLPADSVVDGEVSAKLISAAKLSRRNEIRKKQAKVDMSSRKNVHKEIEDIAKPDDYFSSNENEVAKERRNEIAEFFNGPPVEQFRERNTHLLPVDAELEKQANSDDFEALMQLERLELLRNPNPELFDHDVKIGYCNLYAACSDQLKAVQSTCAQQAGRLVPGLPRRRGGDCHRKLVPDYQAVDELITKVESAFDDCLTEYVGSLRAASANQRTKRQTNIHHMPVVPLPKAMRRAEIKLERPKVCDQSWPALPFYEEKRSCHDRVRIVQNHCNKLRVCCPAVAHCRRTVESSPITERLLAKRDQLSRLSAQCQIRSLNVYRNRQKSRRDHGKGYRNHGDHQQHHPYPYLKAKMAVQTALSRESPGISGGSGDSKQAAIE